MRLPLTSPDSAMFPSFGVKLQEIRPKRKKSPVDSIPEQWVAVSAIAFVTAKKLQLPFRKENREPGRVPVLTCRWPLPQWAPISAAIVAEHSSAIQLREVREVRKVRGPRKNSSSRFSPLVHYSRNPKVSDHWDRQSKWDARRTAWPWIHSGPLSHKSEMPG